MQRPIEQQDEESAAQQGGPLTTASFHNALTHSRDPIGRETNFLVGPYGQKLAGTGINLGKSSSLGDLTNT